MIQTVQLRHLKFLLGQPDTNQLLHEVFGTREIRGIRKLLSNRRLKKKLTQLTQRISRVQFTKLRSMEVGKLTLPSDLDELGYSARLEIEQLVRILSENKKKYLEVVATTITIACYSNHFKVPYEEGPRFRELRKYVLSQEMLDSVGVFNVIIEKLKESNELWEKKFSESRSEDPDFILAGGHRLQNFNTLSVIEAICKKFNISIDNAWKQPFSVVQTTLLKQSIQDDIQVKMTKIKQSKMKSRK